MTAMVEATPEQLRAAAEALNDWADMFYGEGAHAGHTQKQIGRCVSCSCGVRVQGRLPNRKQRERRRSGEQAD